MRNVKGILFIWLLFFILAAASGMATHPGEGALISGRICSPDGCGIPGANIMLVEKKSGRTLTFVSGLEGNYRIAGIPPGTYDLRVETSGFDPEVIQDIDLIEGGSSFVDVTLTFSSIQEAVTVIGQAPRGALQATEARESAARDVGEALTRVNGIWKVRKGGIANDIVLRGFASKDVNVLIDGQRLYGACPNQMDPTSFHVDFSEVDRIEIAKGPFDIRNQGSLGGVLNIITRNPSQGFHTTVALTGGAYGFANPSATVSYAHSNFSALGGFSYRRSLPYTDPSGSRFTEYTNYLDGFEENDAFRIGTGWGKFTFAPCSNHLLQVSFARQEADDVLYPYLKMDAIYDNTNRFNVGYQILPSSSIWKSFRLQTYYSQVSHWMTDEFRTTSVGFPRLYSMGTYAATSAFGVRFEGETANWTFGAEAYDRSWDATTELAGMGYREQYSIPDVSGASVGVFADYRRSLTERLRLAAGVRLDYTRNSADVSLANTDLYFAYNDTRSTKASDVFPSGHAQLTYLLPTGIELHMGIGHVVRVPDARERYFALKRMGSDWVGNPDLVPSQNTGLDGSIFYRTSNLFLSASLYYNDIRNYVYVCNAMRVNSVPGVMNAMARSYENINARIYGSELQAALTLSEKLSFSTALSLVRGSRPINTEEDISGNMAEIPPISSRSVLRFDDGLIWGEIEGIIVGAQNRVDETLSEERTPGHEVVNMRMGITLKNIRFWAGVNNVFNQRFVEHLSYQRDPFRSGIRVFEPGRNLFLNLDFRF